MHISERRACQLVVRVSTRGCDSGATRSRPQMGCAFELGRRVANAGSVRHETLRFKLLQQTGPLKRTTTTAMRIMGMWQTVATEVLELGEYVASPTVVHEYQMPVANIPSSPFAAGRFKTEVVYEADGTVLRRESDIEFSIV